MLFGLLLNISWNANLISYLSTQKTQLPFNNLGELLDTTNYKIAILPESSAEDDFKLSKDSNRQEAWTDRIEPYLDMFPTYSGMHESKICLTGDTIRRINIVS